jgi:hypothetical protein
VERYGRVVDRGPTTISRACDVNILTATRAGRRWRAQRRKFWIAGRPRWIAKNIANRRPLPGTLKRLDFIHSAAWLRVERFPDVPGAVREHPDFRWVLFVSNFNGGWEPYLDSFIDGFGHGIYGLWSKTQGFPRFPGPSTRYDLHRWVKTRLVQSNLLYTAYPGATTHDVRAALRVTRELRSFVATSRTARPDVGVSRPEFERLVHRLQNCLGQSTPTPLPWPKLGPPTANGLSSVVSLAPILPDHEAGLERDLREIANEGDSPFGNVPGTHFARFAILDRRLAGLHPSQQVPLANSWLLFAADFDAHVPTGEALLPRPPTPEVRRYFGEVEAVQALAPVWQHCYGRDQHPTLVDYLESTVVDRLIQYRDYPSVTLRDVLLALAVQDHLRQQLVARSVDLDLLEQDVDGLIQLSMG